MTAYEAGSVTARIELDTSDFDKKIKSLKGKVDDLKVSLQKQGLTDISKEVEAWKKELESSNSTIEKLKKTNEDYKKQLKSLREQVKNNIDFSKKNTDAYEKESRSVEKLNNNLHKLNTETSTSLKIPKGESEVDMMIRKREKLNKLIKEGNLETASYYGKGKSNLHRVGVGTVPKDIDVSNFKRASVVLEGEQKQLYNVSRAIKAYNSEKKLMARANASLENSMTEWLVQLELENALLKGHNKAKFIDDVSINQLNQATTGLKTFNRMLNSTFINYGKLKNIIHTQKTDLSNSQLEKSGQGFSAMNRALKSTMINWSNIGNTFAGLTGQLERASVASQSFYERMKAGSVTFTDLAKSAKYYGRSMQELNTIYQEQASLYAKMGTAQYKYWRQVRNSTVSNPKNWQTGEPFSQARYKVQTVGLQDYYQHINKVSLALDKLQKQQRALKLDVKAYSSKNMENAGRALQVMNKELERNILLEKRRKSVAFQSDKSAYSTANLQKASQGFALLNNKVNEYSNNIKKSDDNVRKAGRGLTSFNNGVVQTAHSGRILSNTLYQIRGALLSLKMIFTAMGGMALWGFAMNIAEGIKTTFAAKNELEAQLKQNAKVGESGILTFNRALDDTVSKFRKINKYALGETVSSVGLEFELTSKQMEKAMPIVAMIQSEYVRAGRTSEEAALAVKDILQGEFQRLSRETGVGKEELIAYGWDEDKTNIEGLLDALGKAAKDRNWDVFAAKATSLNDVVTITQSRFEEFGADFLQSISPAIISGFNTLVDGLTGLQKAWEGLGSFERNAIFGATVMGGLTAIGTALPMITKGMGLAEIGTIGWGKSLATAALNLNKAEVAQYGFRKALAATITGTKASELATTRTTKAIMGRILGVKQSVLAEKGYMTALVHSKGLLMNHTGATNIAKISSMGLAQKTAYLTNNMKLQEAQALGTGKAILKTATSWKVLRTAMLGVIGIGLIGWYTSMANWADKVRKNIEGLNEVIDNGDDMVEDAQKKYDHYNNALEKLNETSKDYLKTKNNLAVAKGNLEDIKNANELAKSYKKINDEAEKNIRNRVDFRKAQSYMKAGIDQNKAYLLASGWEERVKAGQQNYVDSWNKYEQRMYKSSQHINEQIGLMEQANVKEETRIKYIDEYLAKSEEVATNWRKFNQGDLTAGVYAALGEVQLVFIDLWYNDKFQNFIKSATDFLNDIKPTLKQLSIWLKDIGEQLLDLASLLLSTEWGRTAISIGAVGAAIGIVVGKVSKWIGGTNLTIEALRKLGGVIKDRIKDWLNYGKAKEKAETPSTGGTTGKNLPKSGSEAWTGIKMDFYKNAQNFAKYATYIAMAMALVTEAIFLLQAPMWALAETGKTFKAKEKSIRAGIEGLQLIAPTVIAILVPIMALMKAMDMWGSQIMNVKNIGATAIGIGLGMALVAEAIVMLKAPMWALAQVGSDYKNSEADIKQSITAMNTLSDALKAMLPVVPAFLAGIALGAVTFLAPEIGLLLDGAVVVGIAGGMLLLAEAIVMLRAPLEALRELGNSFTDVEGARKGAEAIKLTSEAMSYIEDGLQEVAEVKWDLLAGLVADIVTKVTGRDLGTELLKLTEENGFIDQMNKFATQLNGKSFTPVSPDKAQSLKTVADSMGLINTALESAKTAIDNLPDEFKNGTAGQPLLSYNMESDKIGLSVESTETGFFDQLKEPLKQLKQFVDDFNNNPELDFGDGIDTAKVDAINSAADMVAQVNAAVEKVKTTMGNIGDAGWNANFATGGITSAISGWFGGLTAGTTGGGAGAEGYKSSLGSSLKEMENVISDMVTFNTNVSNLTTGSGGDNSSSVNALSTMVSTVDQAIQHLSDTLSNAVPTIKGNATAIGNGLRDGIKEGIGDLSAGIIAKVVQGANAAKPTASTYGKGIGYSLTQGFKAGLTIAQETGSEIVRTLSYLESKKQEFYDKGKALGDSVSSGYKDGQDMHSPGIIARSTVEEMGRVGSALDDAIATIPSKAYALGNALATNFTPSFASDFGVVEMSGFENGLSSIGTTAVNTNLLTTNAFDTMNSTVATDMLGMTNSVNGNFTSINTTATSSYNNLVNTTRTSLKNMQSQTTRNITAIRTSWKGMQNALIASAENIRQQTSTKIHSLENNMASFWRKIQNPALLLGGAGSDSVSKHTTPRRSGNRIKSSSSPRRLLAAGSPRIGQKVTGISNRFKNTPHVTNGNLRVKEALGQYLQCLLTDGVCMAGGGAWNFNWAKDIQNSFLKWHTHFGEIYDDILTVGKFENDDFPVRGNAQIALRYIEDAIGRTNYEHYYNEKYGSPLEAWNAGHFNCVDGARIAIAFANAFGFGGGSIRYTTWDGEGHGYAYIPGLGVIDATAIQGGYGRMASKVKYAAGSRLINRNKSKSESSGNVINGGVTVNVTIEGNVDNPEETGRRIGEEASRTVLDILKRSHATGL